MYKYRWSFFKDHPEYTITSVKLKVTPKDPVTVTQLSEKVKGCRHANQPIEKSAGCIFQNIVMSGEVVSAASLIDRCGLKGLQIGQAQISKTHANFFINLGGATAADFIQLIKKAKSAVFDKFGILLKEEVIMVGNF